MSGKEKRARKDGADEPGFVVRSELEELLAEAQSANATATRESIKKAVNDLGAKFQNNFAETLRKYDAKTSERFMLVECGIADLRDGQDRLQRQHADLLAQIQQVPSSLAMAEKAVGNELPDPETFDRAPGPSILHINTAGLVALESLQAAVSDVWESAGVKKEDVRLIWPTLGKDFYIKFNGAHGFASKRGRKAFDLLRSQDGTWKKYHVEPLGGSRIDVFISKDKNKKTLREEAAARKLLRAFRQIYEDKKPHLVKKDSSITVDWVHVAEIEATPEQTKVLWNHAGVQKAGIVKNKIMEAFEEGGNFSAAKVEWSL